MSYERERLTITNFLQDQNFFDLEDFGLDADDFEEKANSGFMSILSGQALVESISGSKLLVKTTSVLSITFLLEGGKGSSEAKIKAQEIIDVLFDKKLDENGLLQSNTSDIIIDFGANGFVPYIASLRKEAPFVRTTVNASFVRTERKTRS